MEVSIGAFKLVRTIPTQIAPTDLGTNGATFSSDGSLLAVGEFYNRIGLSGIKIWNTSSGSLQTTPAGGECLCDVNFTADGCYLAAKSSQGIDTEQGRRSDYILLWSLK